MRRFFWLLVLLVISGTVLASDAATSQPAGTKIPRRHILAIASYHIGHRGTAAMYDAVRQGVETLRTPAYDLNLIELDALRTSDPALRERLLLRELPHITEGRYDAIVTFDDEALDLLLQYHDRIPKNTPVVFAGYESFRPELKKDHPNLTGVTQEFDISSTVEVGLRLFPNTREIVIFLDSTPAGRHLEERLRREMPTFHNLPVRLYNDKELPTEKMLEKFSQLPADSLVVMAPWRSAHDTPSPHLSLAGALEERAARPYFITTNDLFGYGALGGYVTDMKRHGEEAFQLLEQVLEAGGAEAIEVKTGALLPMFDFQVMRELGLPMLVLPPKVELVNQPPSLWESYQTELQYIMAFAALVLCIVFLNMRAKGRALAQLKAACAKAAAFAEENRRNLNALRDAQQLRDLLVNALPLHFFIKNAGDHYRYEMTNQAFRNFHHYAETDPDGKNDYDLLSPQKADQIRKLDEAAMAAPLGLDETHTFDDGNGQSHIIRSFRRPFRTADGRELLIGAELDITGEQESRRKLEDANKLWRVVINALPVLFAAKEADHDFRYLLCNHAFAGFLNRSEAELIGQNDDELQLKPDLAESLQRHDHRTMEQKQRQEFTETMFDALGQPHRMRIIKEHFATGDGRQLLLIAAIDISRERNLLESEQSTNRALTQIVMEPDFNLNLERIAHSLQLQLNCDQVVLVRSQPGSDRLPLEFSFHADHIDDLRQQPADDVQKFLAGVTPQLLQNNLIDLAQPRNPRQAQDMEKLNIRSCIGAPVFVDGKLWGAFLVLYHRQMRHFTDIDRSVIRSTANIIALAQLRYQQQVKIQGADQEKQLILNHIAIPIWLYDAAGQLIRVNTAVCEIAGLPEEEVLRLPCNQVFCRHPEPAHGQCPVHQVLKSGKSADCALKIGEREYLINAQPVFNQDGALINVVKTAVDVTELNTIQRKETEQRRLFQGLIDNVPIAVVVKDADHEFRYLMCNPFFSRMSGQRIDELIGKNDTELQLYPGREAELAQLDRQVTEQAKSIHQVDRLQFPGKEPIVCEKFKVPLTLADGRRLLLVAYIDITPLNDLIENEKILNYCMTELLKEDQPDKAISLLLDECRKHLNADRCYVLEYHPYTVSFRYESRPETADSYLTIRPPVSLHQDAAWYRELRERRELFCPDVASAENRRLLGEWMPIAEQYHIHSLYLLAIRREKNLWGNFGIIFETERRELNEREIKFLRNIVRLIEIVLNRKHNQEQLVKALENARSADRAKSYFIATVSHEIRTPLNAVIGFSELLKEDKLDETTQQEYLDSIVNSGHALLQLINDVLDLSKIEADQMNFLPEVTDFNELCREVCAMFRYSADRKGLALNSELSPMPLLSLDKLRLRQILFNLTGNAIKFTPAGSVTIATRFRPENAVRGMLEIKVSDTGLGVSEEDQQRLFKPFVQLDHTRKENAHSQQGTGLGLAITRRMIERMGGTIIVKSSLGRGCCFTITLPHLPYTAAEIPETALIEMPPAPVSQEFTILIVDDVEMNLKVLGAMLRKLQVNVLAAASGEAALQLLAQHHIDLILTDMWMPGMTGEELARRIHAAPEWRDLPLVALTADTESRSNFDMSLFRQIMAKPVTLDKLRQLLPASVTGRA